MISKYSKLIGSLPQPRKTGNRKGQVEAHRAACPCCTATMPISTALTTDGVILLHTFCGCDNSSVLSAVGLSFDDVLPDQPLAHARSSTHPNDWVSVASLADAVSWAAAVASLDPSEANLARVVGYADALHRAAKTAMRGGAR